MVTWLILIIDFCKKTSILSSPALRFLNKPQFLNNSIVERKWEKIDDAWCRIVTFQDGSEAKILGDNLEECVFYSKTLSTSNSVFTHKYISIYIHDCILAYVYIQTYNSKYTSTHNETKIQRYIYQLLPVDFFSHYWLMCLFRLQP